MKGMEPDQEPPDASEPTAVERATPGRIPAAPQDLAAIGAAALEAGEGGPIPPAPLRLRRTERTLAAEITRHRAEVRRLNKLAERRRGADRAASRKIHDAEATMAPGSPCAPGCCRPHKGTRASLAPPPWPRFHPAFGAGDSAGCDSSP